MKGKLEGRAFSYGFSVHSTGLETAHMQLFFLKWFVVKEMATEENVNDSEYLPIKV